MSDIAIKVEHLSKVYKLYDKPVDRMKEALSISRKKYGREHYALKDISFEVKRGETVGIIGTNGSGKSTLLKIITGVLTQSSGKLSVNGKISALLELGAGFNPEYTGLENIYLNGTMMGYKKEEMDKKIDSIIEFADIGEFIHQPVKTYSSGMFVRLAFAVSINIQPDILIIDEALAVGDSRFQAKCFKQIEEFRNSGNSIMIVSHDTDSIKRFCDRVLWIDNGKLMLFGSTEEVVSRYHSFLYQEDDSRKSIFSDEMQAEKSGDPGVKWNQDFSHAISRWGEKTGLIRSIVLNDQRKHEGINLFIKEEIKIDVIFYLDDSFLEKENLYISISIKNKKGQDLIFMSKSLNSVIDRKKENCYKAIFITQNILSPGEYYMVACIELRDDYGIENPQYFDYIDGAIFFEVSSEKKRYYSMINVDYTSQIKVLGVQ